jgi:hypothetical protein
MQVYTNWTYFLRIFYSSSAAARWSFYSIVISLWSISPTGFAIPFTVYRVMQCTNVRLSETRERFCLKRPLNSNRTNRDELLYVRSQKHWPVTWFIMKRKKGKNESSSHENGPCPCGQPNGLVDSSYWKVHGRIA